MGKINKVKYKEIILQVPIDCERDMSGDLMQQAMALLFSMRRAHKTEYSMGVKDKNEQTMQVINISVETKKLKKDEKD
ncbi:MAG: hypothetical protein K5854_09595 [Prevotella sp.]|nr:hypothetical protein [Prevotella sp.]